MDQSRRDFLKDATRFIFLTGPAALAWSTCWRARPRLLRTTWPPATGGPCSSTCRSASAAGTCVRACKEENDVPREPFYFRTWVERYHIPDHATMPTPRRRRARRWTRRTAATTAFPSATTWPGTPRASSCQYVQPLRALPLRAGLPGGRHIREPRRRRAGGQGLLPGPSRPRAGLSLRLPLHRPAHEHGGQVQPLLPPHHEGPDHRLLRGLPHRGPPARRPEEPRGSHPRPDPTTTCRY